MSTRRPNLTGFDHQKFINSAGPAANDPWKRYEAWRYTGPFSRWNRFKGIFPGFWIGAGAFGVYMVYEQVFMRSGHGGGHEEGQH